ncbi:hypothetical protein TUM19329_09860 [Legionella antarctica]|uniref:Uncharacterized protein n=1 Tax=Legionella antarctica TaxID=2708020 RepID=A0A6F8T1T9_9GAMM|nr:hypothetical protein [Legionella antarctica]BCA94625.1 hypothetical protein TUM19329_09860 [Legionella antarctica]
MVKNTSEIRDISLYALHLLVNEGKTPAEISLMLNVPPVVIIGWLQNNSKNEIAKLKDKIIQLEKNISNLRGENYY